MKRYKRFLKWIKGRGRKNYSLDHHIKMAESSFWLYERTQLPEIKEMAEQRMVLHLKTVRRIKEL